MYGRSGYLQYFWRPVPPCGYVLREASVLLPGPVVPPAAVVVVLLLLQGSQGSGQTKVGDLAVAFAVQQDVGGFLVPVDDVARVQVLRGAEQLVHDVALVNILQDVALPNHVVEVRVHELEDQVEVAVILRPMDVEQLDNVGVVAEGLEESDLPERPLGIRLVSEGVKDLLHGNHTTGPEKQKHTVSWNAVLFLLNIKFPAYLSFSRKETDFEPDSS